MVNASEHVLPLYVARITERGGWSLSHEDLKTERVGGAWTDQNGGPEGEPGEHQNRMDGDHRWAQTERGVSEDGGSEH
jgi:hypothetical protein